MINLIINESVECFFDYSVVYKVSENAHCNFYGQGVVEFLVLSTNSPKPKIINLLSYKTEKAANPHIWEDGTRDCFGIFSLTRDLNDDESIGGLIDLNHLLHLSNSFLK